jgi:hypothetical protein
MGTPTVSPLRALAFTVLPGVALTFALISHAMASALIEDISVVAFHLAR